MKRVISVKTSLFRISDKKINKLSEIESAIKRIKTSEGLMFKRTNGMTTVVLLVAIVVCGIAGEQNNNIDKKDKNGPAKTRRCVDPQIQRQYDALGARVKTPGKEKTVYEGKFFNAAGESWNARATVQSPRLAKLEGFLDSKSILSFDGEKANKQMNRLEEGLLELFLVDIPEGLLNEACKSMGLSFLGGGFGPDPRKFPDYSGPRYDIYEFTVPIVYKKAKETKFKTCLFDFQTGLLYKTEYSDESVTPKVKVETRFSAWGKIEDSVYPAKIERYEDGKLIFTFIAEKIEGGPAADASNFQ
jgi:hypothetical protein